MQDFSTFEQRRKAPRVRGWRIRVYLPGKPSQNFPIIWALDVPKQWEDVKQNTSITAATLYRSGRKFDSVYIAKKTPSYE